MQCEINVELFMHDILFYLKKNKLKKIAIEKSFNVKVHFNGINGLKSSSY